MSDRSEKTLGELDERRLEILRGKPLRSRLVWLMIPLAYVGFLIAALVVVISFADGMWLAVGLTILAFGAGVLPEMMTDLRYSKYRREWEIANSGKSGLEGSS